MIKIDNNQSYQKMLLEITVLRDSIESLNRVNQIFNDLDINTSILSWNEIKKKICDIRYDIDELNNMLNFAYTNKCKCNIPEVSESEKFNMYKGGKKYE